MIRSMTGFGRCRQTVEGLDITAEIKSVNNRFFDCSVRLPRSFGYLEERIKPYLQSRGVSRGKVDVWISIETLDSPDTEICLDEGYIAGYLAALYRLRDSFHLRDDISVMSVARNPDTFRIKKPEEDVERDWQRVKVVLDLATDAFLEGREREGASLASDLLFKLQELRTLTDEIERLSAESIDGYRDRLAARIREALADNQITPDEGRLLTECAIFADKVAVDEELVRLRTHFVSMEQILGSDEAVGRKLDFLVQEMNREINTTGSKCNHATIARLVVDAKCILEKIREQIQNLE